VPEVWYKLCYKRNRVDPETIQVMNFIGTGSWARTSDLRIHNPRIVYNNGAFRLFSEKFS
jgi:hypothetical protein